MSDYAEVLQFWFGDDEDDAAVAAAKSALWWSKNAEVDASIRDRFGDRVRAAGEGRLDAWADTPEGRLALILLTDQFTRNIHRDRPEAFAFDARARALCRDGLAQAADRALRPIQRIFFYLPLEHSEDIEDQDWCVDLMRGLAREVPEAWRPTFDDFVGYAEAHQRIIDRFGRFPHRNAILGRTSSDEEIEFLKQPGSSF